MSKFTRRIGLSLLFYFSVSVGYAANANQLPEQFDVENVTLNGVTLLSDEQIQHMLQPLLGKKRHAADLQRAIAALREVYAKQGLPNVKISLNPLSLKKGIVHFDISEMQYGKIVVQGNRDLTETQILAVLPSLRSGNTVQESQLNVELEQARQSLGQQLQIAFQASNQAGVLDVEVQIAEVKKHFFSVTTNNTGSKPTGYARTIFSYQNTNVLDSEQSLVLQLTTSPKHSKNFSAVNASYTIPLQSSNSLSMSASSSRIQVPLDESESMQAGSDSVGLRYSHTLSQQENSTHSVNVVLDHTRHHASKLQQLDVALFNELTVSPISVSYDSQLSHAQSKLSTSVSLSANVSALAGSKQNAFDQYDQISLLPFEANYKVFRFNGSYSYSFANQAWLQIYLNGQFSRDSLIQAERFAIGGVGSVRGFKSAAGSASSGAVVNVELHSPELNMVGNASARALIFADAGMVRNSEPSSKTSAASVGVGVRLNYAEQLTLGVDMARIINSGNASEQYKGDWYGHGNATIAF